MECSCSIDTDTDGDSLKCGRIKIRKAQKIHKCYECYREIVSGEDYEMASGISEDGFFSHKTCGDCLSLRNTFFDNGYTYECIREDLRNTIRDEEDIPEGCISELTPAARAFVCETIERTW